MRRPLHILLALLLLAFAVAVATGCGDDEPSDEPPITEEPGDDESGQDSSEDDPPDSDPFALAGIDPATGAYQGLQPDTREGTPPPSGPDDVEQAAEEAGCTLRLDLPDETDGVDNAHLQPGEAPPNYGTNPANSGVHDSVPVADGSYRKTPPEPNVVHSLEHGRVAIQYSPSLPEEDQLALKGVFDADPDGTLLFPNPNMPYDVAVVGWTNLMGCNDPTDAEALAAAVAAFQNGFRGQGPEQIPL